MKEEGEREKGVDGEKREFEGGKERNLELISFRFEFTGPSLHAINFMVGIAVYGPYKP